MAEGGAPTEDVAGVGVNEMVEEEVDPAEKLSSCHIMLKAASSAGEAGGVAGEVGATTGAEEAGGAKLRVEGDGILREHQRWAEGCQCLWKMTHQKPPCPIRLTCWPMSDQSVVVSPWGC